MIEPDVVALPTEAPLNDDGDWPAPSRAWATVFALLLAYIVSFADRQIMSLLVGPIKADLGLSDTQYSLLAGLAFAIFFTFMGLPFGRLADRARRKVIVAAGALAGGMAALTAGLAGSFAALFGARIFAGAADAALGPSAFSMLADLFPPSKRGRAFSIYSLGIYVGAGIAFGAGGVIVGMVAETPTTILPLIGEIKSWQAVFFVIAIPALVLSPLLLLIKEPKRRGRVSTTGSIPIGEAVAYVWQRRGLFGPFFVGFGIVVLAGFATLAWTPEFFIRHFGMSPRDAGINIGMTMVLAGSIGVLAGGWFVDWMMRRGHKDAVLIAGILAAFGGLVPGVLFPLMPTAQLAQFMLAPVFFFGAFASGAAPSAIGAVTPNELRGQVSALYLLVINLLGIGLGPTVPALITDFVFADEAMLGQSLAWTAAITGLPAIILLWMARSRYVAEAQDR